MPPSAAASPWAAWVSSPCWNSRHTRQRLQTAVAGERAASCAIVSVTKESMGQPAFPGGECYQDPGLCGGCPQGCLPRSADPASSRERYTHLHSPTHPTAASAQRQNLIIQIGPRSGWGSTVSLDLRAMKRERQGIQPHMQHYSGGWAGVAVLHLPVQNGDGHWTYGRADWSPANIGKIPD